MGGRRGAHRDEDREQRRGVHNTQERGGCRQGANGKWMERSAASGTAVGGRGRTRRRDAHGLREGRERAREAQAHAAGVAMEGRRSTLNRRKECATDEAEDDAQTGKDAQRARWRGGSNGEGTAGEKRSKERAGSEERSTQDARRASTETRRETSAKNPEKWSVQNGRR